MLDTKRFDEDCNGWACLAVVKGDLSAGDVVPINGNEIHHDGFPAIASGGNLIVYENDGDVHESDLWAVSRSNNAGAWVGPVLLTGSSSYQYNYQPAVNATGTKVRLTAPMHPNRGRPASARWGRMERGFGWC